MYYFPHKEIYIARYLCIFGDYEYLANMLGLEFDSQKSMNEFFLMLARDPE